MVPRMMKNMNPEEHKEQIRWDNQAWQEPQGIPQGMPQGPPQVADSAPSVMMQGQVQNDGFEYLEWPAASGDWWYRTGAGMNWAKWEK